MTISLPLTEVESSSCAILDDESSQVFRFSVEDIPSQEPRDVLYVAANVGVLEELFPVSVPSRWKSRDCPMDTRKLSQVEEPGEGFVESLNGAVGLDEEACKPLAEVTITCVPSVCDLGEEFKGLCQEACLTCVVRCIQLHKTHDEVLWDWVRLVGD